MATGSLPASSTKPEHERYIERQLNKTRRQVKLVELGVATVTLLVGVLAFFLVAALLDHWLLPLGFAGRFALLVLLLAGVAWHVWAFFVPLLRNSINPAYAALTIEHSAPSLKNSLINFLMLRSQRGQVHDVVYEAVEQRAATDLQAVPMDSVIDYSPLIKIGYALAAVFAITAAYKILSPKDPLQTAARVAAPWADIARPSRVQIEAVEPGDSEQFFGDSVRVSATLRGVRSTDRVVLVYSTADGQTVDKRLEMTPDESGLHYTAPLPGTGEGLQQDVTYRLEAGDAVSRDYALSVVAAPTIVVEKLAYDYPRYTQKPREIRERTADIRALEGTRVTVYAQANQPIHAAYIEFNPAAAAADPSVKPQRLAMEAADRQATGSFVLELAADRTTPTYGSYQITFMTAAGHPGQDPALHTIDVIRDLPPEIEILSPKEQQLEVPENGEALVEVRAVDPDFALSRVGLRLTAGSKEIATKALLESAQGHSGQSITRFRFRPADYDLQAGDEVAWWATAADNRMAPKTSLAEPNTERTKNYFFKIVAADPNAKPQPNEGQQDKNQQPMNGEPQPGENADQQGNDPQPGDAQPSDKNDKQDPAQNLNEEPMNDSGQEGDQGSGSQKSQGKSDKPQPGEQDSQTENQESGGQSGKNDKSDGASDEPMPGDKADQPQDQPDGASGGKQDGAGSKSDQPQEGEQGGMSPAGSGDNRNQDAPGDKNEPGKEGAPPDQGSDGGNDSGNEQGGSKNDRGASGGQPNGSGQNSDSSEPQERHEGEIIEEILDRMIKQAEQEQKNGKGQSQPQPGDGQQKPSQEDFDKLPQHIKDKLQKLMEKHRQQNGESQKTDQAPAGLQSDSPRESAQGGNQPGESQGAKPKDQQQPQPSGASETGEGTDKRPMTDAAGSDKKQGSGASNERGSGETGKPDEAANTRPEKKSNSSEPMSDEKRQGGLGSNGQSGAGTPSDNKQGAAQAQEANRDKPKTQQPGDQEPSPGDQAQSPSGSKRQSDSQGGEGGDRSGGGKQGPGQGANSAGNDKAGSNSAADEGAGAAQESGEGDTAARAGDKKQAEGRTGKSGTEAGDGSATKKGPRGDRPPQDATGGQPGESSEDPMPSGQDDSDARGKAGDFVTGGGKPSDNDGVSKFADAAGPEAEKAKLDYARNATDLVLEYLKDQQDKPDQELLDDLGWSQDDLKQFLERWSEAKREAAHNPQAQGELDEALRSLGLRPGQDKVRRGAARSDNLRGLGDVGPTSGPPSKYLEQFRAFKKGAARAK